MTSKLVALPNTGFAPNNESIARHLHEQADWMLLDDARELRNVVLVLEYSDGDLRRQVCGMPCDIARMIGLLQMASANALLNGVEK